MNRHYPKNGLPARILIVLGLVGGSFISARAFEFGGANDIAAVSGRVSKDYVRTRLSNGSFEPETYVFGKGGYWSGSMADFSIDKMTFLEVAHTIAGPLASQGYIPSKDPKATKLLVMVYWGTTRVPGRANESVGVSTAQIANQTLDAAISTGAAPSVVEALQDQITTAMMVVGAEDRIRERADIVNVKMLGYDSWWEATSGDRRGTAVEHERKDLSEEIENERYFVVLMAYDFQLLYGQKKHKFLWETRFSIRQLHHQFDRDLPTMAQYASQYFGQDSHGLVHDMVPMGRVNVGELKSLGEAPEK
jgi:hypothetical protein